MSGQGRTVLRVALLWFTALVVLALNADADVVGRCWDAIQEELAPAGASEALVRNLCRLGPADRRALPVLKAIHAKTDGTERWLAAVGLARMGDASGTGTLVGALDAADRKQAATSAAALAALDHARGIDWIRLCLLRGHSEWAEPVCRAVADLDVRSRVPLLARVVRDEHALTLVRHEAVAALLRLGDPRGPAWSDLLLMKTRERADLVQTLGRTRDRAAFGPLESAFERFGSEMPHVFLLAFLELGDPRALPLVRSLPHTVDPDRLSPVELTMAALGDRPSVKKCLKLLRAGQSGPAATAVQQALARCPEAALPADLAADVGQPRGCLLTAQALLLRSDERSAEVLWRLAQAMSSEARTSFTAEAVLRPNGAALPLLRAEFRRERESRRKAELASALIMAHQSRRTGRCFFAPDQLF